MHAPSQILSQYIKRFSSLFASAPSSHALQFFNGLRAISFLWIFFGHVFGFFLPFLSVEALGTAVREMKGTFLLSTLNGATYAVDTFFFMSGCLAAYNGVKVVRRARGFGNRLKQASVSILIRYIRFVGPLLIILISQFFYRPHWSPTEFGRKVLSSSATGMHGGCRRYWWSILLLINTVVDGGRGTDCVSWAWYLGNDFLFYLVAMVIVVVFAYDKRAGLATAGILLFGSLYSSLHIVRTYNLPDASLDYVSLCGIDPATSSKSDPIVTAADIWKTPAFRLFYIAPWVRIQAYLIGVLLGLYLCSEDGEASPKEGSVQIPETAVKEADLMKKPKAAVAEIASLTESCASTAMQGPPLQQPIKDTNPSTFTSQRDLGSRSVAAPRIGNRVTQKSEWRSHALWNPGLIQFLSLVGLASMIFLPLLDNGEPQTPLARQMALVVFAWSRCFWAVCIAALTVLAMMGQLSSYLLGFLSHQFWAPIATLSFSLYLCHPIVMVIGYAVLSDRISYFPKGGLFVRYFCGSLALSALLAILLYVLVEVPLREGGAKLARYVRSSNRKALA